jgi:hypothetical protein
LRVSGHPDAQGAGIATDRRAQRIARGPFDDEVVASPRFELEEQLEARLDVTRDAIVALHGQRRQERATVEQALGLGTLGREIALHRARTSCAGDEDVCGLAARAKSYPLVASRHNAQAHAKRGAGPEQLHAKPSVGRLDGRPGHLAERLRAAHGDMRTDRGERLRGPRDAGLRHLDALAEDLRDAGHRLAPLLEHDAARLLPREDPGAIPVAGEHGQARPLRGLFDADLRLATLDRDRAVGVVNARVAHREEERSEGNRG